MDIDLFKMIVDRSLEELYLEAVHLYGLGESYLVPQVMDYFDYAVERYYEAGVRTVLITNGERVTRFPERISVVDISFNAGTKETFREINGYDFERTVKNVWRLEREGGLGPHVNLHMLVFNRNAHETEEFKKLFAFTSAGLTLAYKYDNQCGKIDDETLLDYRKNHRIPCHYVRNTIYVCWNGDVILCCHDADGEVVHGNVKTMTFEEIWYGHRHTDQMIQHNRGIFAGLCRLCNFNVPIVEQNMRVTKQERIELRKRYLDFALEHMVQCPRANRCRFVKRYRENLEQMEGLSNSLIRICADDPRFYGMDSICNLAADPECPHLSKLRQRAREARITWEGPILGPSGYAFAARNYVLGLADAGVAIRAQPLWHDCDLELSE